MNGGFIRGGGQRGADSHAGIAALLRSLRPLIDDCLPFAQCLASGEHEHTYISTVSKRALDCNRINSHTPVSRVPASLRVNMATQQVTAAPVQKDLVVSLAPNYSRPLAVVTTLFFMWGFLTCLNDILVPHLKSIFDLSYARVMLVQFAFFSTYFLFSVPWSKVVNKIGYQRTMVVGLLTMTVGALLFVPAASAASYPLFLTALIVLAGGITGLQHRFAGYITKEA